MLQSDCTICVFYLLAPKEHEGKLTQFAKFVCGHVGPHTT